VKKTILFFVLICICATNLSFTTSKIYIATAYSLRGRTASGIWPRKGIVAADTKFHKLGSTILIQGSSYSGTYLVADTGKKIKGKRIDIWMQSRKEAKKFGKRKVLVN
jgi:resuscitation-promoting factor RpfB